MPVTLRKIITFYVQGFRSMTLGKSLWKIIIIKFIVIFVVIKFFFCPDYLKSRYNTDEERAAHVFAKITAAADHH